MSARIQLWDWEKTIFRQLLYQAPDGADSFISIRDAAAAAGHPHIHSDKLNGFANKLVALGYGTSQIREISVPAVDVDFRLSEAGRSAALEEASTLKYRGPLERASKLNWSAIASIVSAIAAVASAIFAYRVTH